MSDTAGAQVPFLGRVAGDGSTALDTVAWQAPVVTPTRCGSIRPIVISTEENLYGVHANRERRRGDSRSLDASSSSRVGAGLQYNSGGSERYHGCGAARR